MRKRGADDVGTCGCGKYMGLVLGEREAIEVSEAGE